MTSNPNTSLDRKELVNILMLYRAEGNSEKAIRSITEWVEKEVVGPPEMLIEGDSYKDNNERLIRNNLRIEQRRRLK